MRECDLEQQNKKNSSRLKSYTPNGMVDALRRNILFHKTYNPMLDSKQNQQVCKQILNVGDEEFRIANTKIVFDKRYNLKPPVNEEIEKLKRIEREKLN